MYTAATLFTTPGGVVRTIGPLLLLVLLGSGCVSQIPYDQLTHWPTVRGGTFPAYHLRQQGDMAAGLLAHGNGETVILDGLYYYAARPDGSLYQLRSTEPLVAGWSVRFRPDLVEMLEPGTTFEHLSARLATAVPDLAHACAWRLVGRFEEVRLASGTLLPRVSGQLIGFRAPLTGGREVPLELYFISADWLSGGRVAGFRLIDGSLALDLCPRYLQINSASGEALQQLRR